MTVDLEGGGIAKHNRQLQLPAALQVQHDMPPQAAIGTALEALIYTVPVAVAFWQISATKCRYEARTIE